MVEELQSDAGYRFHLIGEEAPAFRPGRNRP